MAAASRCVGFALLEQPGALPTQGHKTFQLCGIDVLADVQGVFKRVLDVQRGHLWLVLLSALEEGKGTVLAHQHTSLSSSTSSCHKGSFVCTVCVIVHLSGWSWFYLSAAVFGALMS